MSHFTRTVLPFLLVYLLIGCASSSENQEKLVRDALSMPVASTDAILGRLAPHLIASPQTSLEVEINALINASIDNGWDLDFHPGGILYHIDTKGSGKPLRWGDHISVHYQGWTLDGKVFDSSFHRDEPFQFYVGNVVPGWNELLQHLMVEGSRGIFIIPSSLAYGEEGFGKLVAPNENLVFDIEVLLQDQVED